MRKKQDTKEIVQIFKDKLDDSNLISDLFDYLEFDCQTRAFVNPSVLD